MGKNVDHDGGHTGAKESVCVCEKEKREERRSWEEGKMYMLR